jgi:membrane fusion protein (multidrug efflux system)
LPVKRIILFIVIVAALAGGAWWGHDYWQTGRFMVSTDDAYVKADETTIAPKVPGYLAEVLVKDNQQVKAGDILALIGDSDYRTALDQANAQVAVAVAGVHSDEAQVALQQSVIAQARAKVESDRAATTLSQQNQNRYADLARQGVGTVQRAQEANADLRQKNALIDADQAAVAAAEQRLGVLAAAREQSAAEAKLAVARAHQAELNLSYTILRAPIAGTVGNRTLRVGQYVQAGTALMAIVPLKSVYVIANYKETQLTRVWPGQPADVTVDSFPDHVIKGRVDSLSPASGLEFALLPPDNATGNFTKVVQRVPVKIALDPNDPLIERLRPGTSAEPVIDTRQLPEAARQAQAQ